MKKSLQVASFLLGAAILTACQSTTASNPTLTNNPSKAVTIPLSDAKLQNYDWQLVSVTDKTDKPSTSKGLRADKPLTMKFEQGGKITFKNTCNKMWGNYMLTNDNVVVGDIASTRMMCEPDLMTVDTLAVTAVKGQFKLTEDAKGQPVLTVTGDNQISVFQPKVK